MHEQLHVSDAPNFEPNDPQIQVFIRTEEEAAALEGEIAETGGARRMLTTEYDVFACDAFQEDKGRWLRLMPNATFIPT